MDLEQQVIQQFKASIELKKRSMELLPGGITGASEALVSCLLNGNKILSCGIGGSAASAQGFAASLVGRFENERPGLPALALTSDGAVLTALADDDGFRQVFARQVRALGQPGDALLMLASNGNAAIMLEALKAAHDRSMTVVALTGGDGGQMVETLASADIELRVPGNAPLRIQEVHDLILHCLCHLIDIQLFGGS